MPTEHRVISGLGWDLTSVRALYWGTPGAPYWHGFDYTPPGAQEAALDLRHPAGEAATEDLPVLVKTWWAWGSGELRFTTFNYSITSNCTGFYVELKDAANNYHGRLTYVHLDPKTMQPFNDTWVSQPGTWTLRYLGAVAELHEQPGCPYFGVHLHQGQKVMPSFQMDFNSGLPGLGTDIIEPTDDPWSNWLHRVVMIQPDDWDRDGCVDSQEVSMGFDPYNFWDFYSVPVPARPDPLPNGLRNGAIDITDVLAVLFYSGAADTGPPNGNGVDYDSVKGSCDWNRDGNPDEEGRCYDRSPSAPPNPPHEAGPPNGAVDISDVMGALAQSGLDCTS